jgi:hypothetical protein
LSRKKSQKRKIWCGFVLLPTAADRFGPLGESVGFCLEKKTPSFVSSTLLVCGPSDGSRQC